MDEFFQKLREIQKKERNLSGLAPVGENFYQEVSNYFNRLMRKIDNNPFSFESYLLRDAQRIIAEICERREHKISNSAVMNVQRSYNLFKESKPVSMSQMKVPRNSTPEEENLYRALVASLVTYREKMRDPLRFHSTQSHIAKEKSDKSPGLKENSLAKSLEISNAKLDDRRLNSGEEANKSDNIYEKFGSEPSEDPASSENISGSEVPRDRKSIKNNNLVEMNTEEEDQILKNITNNQKNPAEVLMILEELPTIMGVDQQIYGPFSPQDIITMPKPNAQILIKNRKGKFIQKI